MPDITKTLAEPCGECGMLCHPAEFHPYAACLMFKGCHDGEKVRANLAAAVTQGAGTEEVERLVRAAKVLLHEAEAANARMLREAGAGIIDLNATREARAAIDALALAARNAPATPAGWSIQRQKDGAMLVTGPEGGCLVHADEPEPRWFTADTLYALCEALIGPQAGEEASHG